MKTVIKNVTIVTMNQEKEVIQNGFVCFDQKQILTVGKMADYQANGAKEVDGCQGILMPGMVNLHTHLGMIPFRGLGDDCKDRLRKFLLPMEQRCMTKELAAASARYAACELLLSGVTTALDMYYYEAEVADALAEVGIRAILGETVMEEDSCRFTGFEALEETIAKWHNHPLLSICPAPHATNTCSAKTLQTCHALAKKYQVPFTLHVSEMDYEIDYFKKTYGLSPIGFLDQLGVLDQRTIAAHCILVDDADIVMLSERKSSVAHCIGSNTKAAKGVAPVSRMLSAGVTVGLGTDGPASGNTIDLLTQFKLFANFHKNELHDRSAFPCEEIVALGTIAGARALGMEQLIGSIEVGKQADLVLLETQSVNMFPIYDPYSAIVYSANSANVDTVYVAGICQVKNKQLKNSSLRAVRTALQDEMNQVCFAETAASL